jgi:hypothetical protein
MDPTSSIQVFAAKRAGRGANGYERDRGAVWHAVKGSSPQNVAYSLASALCGVAPGARSVGWSGQVQTVEHVSCPRCLKKLSRQEPARVTA